MELVVHAVEASSRANGPGDRFVIWVQGCDLGCPGCFNPTTHETGTRPATRVADLVAQIRDASANLEGITISGGEPLQQPDGLLALLRQVRRQTPELSVLLFSGYRRDEIEAMPLGPTILEHLDVLIDGRYQAPVRVSRGLRGSDNQRIWLLSERYTRADIEATPEAEIRIAPDGSLVMTGVAPFRLD